MESYNGKTNHVWKSSNISDKPLKDEMLRVGNAMKEKKKEEKLKKKEKTLMLAAYIKEWSKQKDDLELEDHKVSFIHHYEDYWYFLCKSFNLFYSLYLN